MSNPKMPKGWTVYDPNTGEQNRPVECGNCGWKGRENDIPEGLWGVSDIYDRLDAGSVVPAGECPGKEDGYLCGAFVYYADTTVAYKKVLNVLEQLVEATE